MKLYEVVSVYGLREVPCRASRSLAHWPGYRPDEEGAAVDGMWGTGGMSAVGVPWSEANQAGSFLGQKTVLNEFVTFSDIAQLGLPAVLGGTLANLMSAAIAGIVIS